MAKMLQNNDEMGNFQLPGNEPRERSTRFPTGALWDLHRERISELYVEQSRTLTDVRRIMEEEYDFTASMSMYKKRIAKWDLHKNYKASEKDEILQRLQTLDINSQDDHNLTIHHKDVKMHRIRRHLKARKKHEAENAIRGFGKIVVCTNDAPTQMAKSGSMISPSSCLHAASFSSIFTNDPFQSKPKSELTRKIQSWYLNLDFSQCNSTKREEDLLLALDHCMHNGVVTIFAAHSSSTCQLTNTYNEILSNVAAFHNHVLSALYNFKAKEYQHARGSLDDACEILTMMLRKREWPIIFKLCEMFVWSDWGTLVAVREYIFMFAYRYARELRKEEDPFAEVLRHLAGQHVLNTMVESAWNMMLDKINKQASLVTTEVVWDLQLHAISTFKRRFDYDTASRLASGLVLFGEQEYGYSSDQTCIALTRLGRVYCKQGQLKLAKEVYAEALHRRLKDRGGEAMKWTDYYPCRDLALVNGALELYFEAEQCWHLAFQHIEDIESRTAEPMQKYDLEKSYCIKMLQNALVKQGKWAEAQELEEKYGSLHTPLSLMLVEEDQNIWIWAAKMNDRFCLAALLKNGRMPTSTSTVRSVSDTEAAR